MATAAAFDAANAHPSHEWARTSRLCPNATLNAETTRNRRAFLPYRRSMRSSGGAPVSRLSIVMFPTRTAARTAKACWTETPDVNPNLLIRAARPMEPPPGLIAVSVPKVVLLLTELEYVRGLKRGR
jgi:hypothetical protein